MLTSMGRLKNVLDAGHREQDYRREDMENTAERGLNTLISEMAERRERVGRSDGRLGSRLEEMEKEENERREAENERREAEHGSDADGERPGEATRRSEEQYMPPEEFLKEQTEAARARAEEDLDREADEISRRSDSDDEEMSAKEGAKRRRTVF